MGWSFFAPCSKHGQLWVQLLSRGARAGGLSPPRFGAENIASAAQNWLGKNIQSDDLFINRFLRIALGAIIFSRIFFWTTPACVREANQLLDFSTKLDRSGLYFTFPVESATSERTFSVLRRLKNYLRSTMKQDSVNNCLIICCHKSIMNTLDTVKIAKRYAYANELRKGHFGKCE